MSLPNEMDGRFSQSDFVGPAPEEQPNARSGDNHPVLPVAAAASIVQDNIGLRM